MAMGETFSLFLSLLPFSLLMEVLMNQLKCGAKYVVIWCNVFCRFVVKMVTETGSADKGMRSMVPPQRTVEVGGAFRFGGHVYGVVERSGVEQARDACRGCAFASRNCPQSYACSSFDRSDGVSVWFVREY